MSNVIRVSAPRSARYEPPFSLDRALETLRSYARPLHVIQSRLKAADIKPGIGWEGLKEKLDPTHAKFAETGSVFVEVYKEQILLGSRLCRIYDGVNFDWNAIAEKCAALQTSDGSYCASYPLPLVESNLKNQSFDHVELVAVSKIDETDWGLVFCSRRSYSTRVDVDSQKLNHGALAELSRIVGGFDAIVALTEHHLQAFDLVVIRPGLGRLEVRLDHPRALADQGLIDDAHQRLFGVLASLFPALNELMHSQKNFYPAIQAIYLDKNCGCVEELSFVPPTGSVIRHRIKSKGDDLRIEEFHLGGCEKVGGSDKIRPYTLSVVLPLIDGKESCVTLTLRASYRDLQQPTPSLVDCMVEKCTNEREFRSALNKLVAYS